MEKPSRIPLKILKGMREARLKRERKEKEKVISWKNDQMDDTILPTQHTYLVIEILASYLSPTHINVYRQLLEMYIIHNTFMIDMTR
jgi:hypothetical protein